MSSSYALAARSSASCWRRRICGPPLDVLRIYERGSPKGSRVEREIDGCDDQLDVAVSREPGGVNEILARADDGLYRASVAAEVWLLFMEKRA
jgi:hypothetical protein